MPGRIRKTDSDAYGKGYSGIDLPEGVLRPSRAHRPSPSSGSATDCRTATSTESNVSSTSCPRRSSKVATAGVLLNPFKLHALLGAVSSSLVTDPSLDLVTLAGQFENLSSGKINFVTLPNSGPQLIYPDGVATSIVQVDTAAIPDFVRRLMGQSTDPGLARVSAAAPASVTLDVLNGTPVAGVAGRNADASASGRVHRRRRRLHGGSDGDCGGIPARATERSEGHSGRRPGRGARPDRCGAARHTRAGHGRTRGPRGRDERGSGVVQPPTGLDADITGKFGPEIVSHAACW